MNRFRRVDKTATRGIWILSGVALASAVAARAGDIDPGLDPQFREHDLPAAANEVLVENTRTAAALRIGGNHPLVRHHVWGTDQVICPVPFVAVRVAPGETFRWKDQYELIVRK